MSQRTNKFIKWLSGSRIKFLTIMHLLSLFAFGSLGLASDFENQYESAHFIFHYNDDTLIDHLSRFCDGFIELVNRDFFEVPIDSPIHVYILKDREAFKRYLADTLHVSKSPGYGMYLPQRGGFVTYENAGLEAFAHEIIHTLMLHKSHSFPVWANEGIPSFFEKFFGYWEGDKLCLDFGFQSSWRIDKMRRTIVQLDLERMIRHGRNFTTSEKRLVSMFLFQQGKLKTYLDLVKVRQKKGYNTFVEAAFERELTELVPLWQQYLRDVYENRTHICGIPDSQVFDSKDEYDFFLIYQDLNFIGR